MKYKTTSKAIKQSGALVINLGYCEATYLLRYREPLAYNSGVYGWNYDAYDFYTRSGKEVIVCTGYRGMPGKRPAIPVTDYEKQARDICGDWFIPYEEQRERVNKLLIGWIAENMRCNNEH